MEAERANHARILRDLRAGQQAAANIRAALTGKPALLDDLVTLERLAADRKGSDANAVGPRGTTPWLMACAEGVLADAQVLLAAGADVTLEGKDWVEVADGVERVQEFPLAAAARKGHTAVVGLLLAQEGVDANQGTTDDGRTALWSACFGGHTDVVELLLACDGVEVNKAMTDNGGTPLCIACENGHTEVVGLLLACEDIDVNKAVTSNGFSPLFVACQEGHTKVVGLLLACDGVDVNKATIDTGVTPLFMACQKGRTEVVELLLACDAIDVNKARTTDGGTPLHAAALFGHRSIAQLLVVFGANMAATAAFEGEHETPQKWTTYDGHHELAAWLGAVAGWSPLRVAAGCRLHTPIATMLKQGRMDPDAQPWSQLALARATSTTPPTELPWQDALDVCQITVKLIKAATRGWAPPRHWLHHAGVRTAVRTVLQVGEWLHRQDVLVRSLESSTAAARTAAAVDDVLPILPPEMWIAIMGFFLRNNWAVV
jgi:ankyrin repeat protein